MITVTTHEALQAHLTKSKQIGKTIGFVPTLGALHHGHMSLIRQAKQSCDVVICSIFLNPTQFDNQSDLEKYPKTLEKDSALLHEHGCDILFLPSVNEVYPHGMKLTKPYDLGELEHILEGATRPGHYQGVAQVVHRLIELTTPDVLFLGQKDFQQVGIIQRMIDLQDLPVEITICPIIREEDGLAMSSRNVRLSEKERAVANELFLTLQKCKEHIHRFTIEELQTWAVASLNANPLIHVDYIAFYDAKNFEQITEVNKSTSIVILGAIFLGPIRIIDNVLV